MKILKNNFANFILIILLLISFGLFLFFITQLRTYDYFAVIVKKERDEIYISNINLDKILDKKVNLFINVDDKLSRYEILIDNKLTEDGILIKSLPLINSLEKNNIYSIQAYISVEKEIFMSRILNLIKTITNN
ncbi:hypothetical protein MCANPG14_01243 [Mycoplasmopsis canis PG 14]|uniref:Uncharacterized protein n=1 Tax=Mycoplasmopsis canis TaxID=29555 RepID=A0A449AQJ9_9BACT|nr:hypothetical protein [Mycoplasmopsis canis]AMD81268.1 hypothetical protein AXW82_01740 [Mycoplasmopsis canis PG 14]EIE40591.1 hypothetical protein MCANPG14_01243 [Mycoplasmopsis canis PG 14]VEU68760.1 Uncharacterised protein [Mycoplasmopsis canis]